MGGRYIITGVQIGIIKAHLQNIDVSSVDKILEYILEKQYFCEKNELVALRKLLEKTK